MKTQYKELDDLAKIISACSRCGFCMVECPAYGVTKIEWDAARGRNKMAKELLNSNVNLDKDLEEPIDSCLMCRSCYENCPSKVDTPKAVQLMRTIRYKEGKMKLPYRILFERVFTNPGLMRRGAMMLSGVQKTGLDKLGLGIAARFIPIAKAAQKVMPQLPFKSARTVLPKINKPKIKQKGKVLYFIGCASDYAFSEVCIATVNVLQNHGIEVVIPEVSCCGLPAHTYGHIDAARKLAETNIEILNKYEADAIISDCPTCLAFLKDYPELFSSGKIRNEAVMIADKIKDIAEYLLELDWEKPKKRINKIITYHRPCHVGRFLNTGKDVEKIIESLPGIDFRKAPNQDDCCGGAGSYCITQYERSEQILEKKMTGLASTKAQFIVTNCPACIMQLSSGIKSSPDPKTKNLKVVHLMQLLDMYYS